MIGHRTHLSTCLSHHLSAKLLYTIQYSEYCIYLAPGNLNLYEYCTLYCTLARVDIYSTEYSYRVLYVQYWSTVHVPTTVHVLYYSAYRLTPRPRVRLLAPTRVLASTRVLYIRASHTSTPVLYCTKE
jgi:hypothetical protein